MRSLIMPAERSLERNNESSNRALVREAAGRWGCAEAYARHGEIVVRIEARLAAIIFSVRLALLGLIAACLV